MPLRGLLCLVSLLIASRAAAQAPVGGKPDLPKIVLIGDSIRMGYAPLVAKRLEGRAVVLSPAANGGDSDNVLKHVEEWAIRVKPAVVHFNCGLHDLKRFKKDKQYQVALDRYQSNLRRIVARLHKETSAALVFVNTTPILDARHAKRGANFDRFEEDVRRYNSAALSVMNEVGVPVHDLHWVVEKGGPATLLGSDGTHYTAAGNARLAEVVADCVLRHLAVVQYRPFKAPPSGPEAEAAYRKDEARRDALVPPLYKKLRVPDFPVPADAAAWKKQQPEVRRKVVESLGDLPPRPTPVRARVVSRELRHNYTLECVSIDNGAEGAVSALLLVPHKAPRPAPAILWLHSSTPDKNQIVIPNSNGGKEPLGEVFVRAGYVVLAPDAYWHGDRVGTGPAGAAETGRAEQESLHKLDLWLGRTLWGMFVRDDQVALDYLCSRPEVDGKHIGVTGMSMGSTRAWWLAAVDDRVAAAVGVACLTRYENLIRHGQLRQHGVYYYCYGCSRHFDTEGVLALIAPRPFLALTGDLDAGSPADGIKVLEKKVSRVYGTLGAAERFRSILYPQVGHDYTPRMRAEMLAWFERWLRPSKDE